MRKLLIILMFLAGLWATASVRSQDRAEPEVREMREPGPRMGVPQRGDSMRAAPPVIYRNRPGHQMEDPRARQLENRQLQQLQRQLPQDEVRDPRTFSYRTRPSQVDGSAYVPRDMQRAIEKAQSEHGGKVLSADRIRYRGQDTYRVKLLTPGGRVRVVQLSEQPAPDAETTDDQRKGDQ
jgi:hypothetical protein